VGPIPIRKFCIYNGVYCCRMERVLVGRRRRRNKSTSLFVRWN